MRDKGFLFSVLTFMLSLSVLTVAAYYGSLSTNKDISAEKTLNIYHDIACDLPELRKTRYEIREGELVIFDEIPYENGSDSVNSYIDFLEGTYSNELNTQLKIYTNKPGYALSGGLTYDYPNHRKKVVRLYNLSGQSLSDYFVGLHFDLDLVNVTSDVDSDPQGLRVELNGSFKNTTYHRVDYVKADESSTWRFNLKEAAVIVNAGLADIEGLKNGSLTIEPVNCQGVVETRLPAQQVVSNMVVEITDRVSKTDYLSIT